MREFLFVATGVCLAYFVAAFGAYALLLVFAALDNAISSRDARADDLRALEESRFTIPVSVLVPVYNEAAVIRHVVAALRDLRYPELELVMAVDGSTDGTLEILRADLQLEPVARFERHIVDTKPVREVLRSRVDPRILVVAKENGGKADALNCALNYARYRYVCCVDGDTIYLPEALLNTMRLVVRDPKSIVGITGHIAVAMQPERLTVDADGRAMVENKLIANFQHIEYLRAFLNARLAWSRLGFMLCASGAFAIWRRDLLEELGGFSTEYTCEDIEFTFRAHEHLRRTGVDYRILSTPQIAARTEGPGTIRALVRQRERWQRVTLEVIWSYRRMLLRRRYGVVGFVGMPFFLLTEVLAPPMELVSIVTLVLGIAYRVFDVRVYAVFLASVAMANAIMTSAAILLEDISTRAFRLDHLARLVVLGPLEVLVYRPVLVWARLKGFWRFLRKERSWETFDRNPRLASR
ncbi:MAG TPA: glycosyltransferase [Gaiellaceae bacterium]